MHLGLRNKSDLNIHTWNRNGMEWNRNHKTWQCCTRAEPTFSSLTNWCSSQPYGKQSCVTIVFLYATHISRVLLCTTCFVKCYGCEFNQGTYNFCALRIYSIIENEYEFGWKVAKIIALMEVGAYARRQTWEASLRMQCLDFSEGSRYHHHHKHLSFLL